MIHGETQAPLESTPRQRRRATNLARILDAAIELVAEGGMDALSMQRLADALDYTPGALYRYYAGKDAVIAAMTVQVIQGVAEALRAAAADAPEHAHLQRVIVLALAYRDLARTAPHRFGLLSMLLADPRVLVVEDAAALPAMRAIEEALEPLVDALHGAASTGAVAPGAAPARAVVVFASVHGLLQLRKQARRLPELLDLDGLVALSLRSLLVGWGAAPAELDAILAQALRRAPTTLQLPGGLS